MSACVQIVDGPIRQPAPAESPGAGAVLTFEGVVRPEEAGERIEALEYSVYEPMASRQLQRLSEETLGRFGLLGVDVFHSRGLVAAGEVSFLLRIHARHRAEALAAADDFINRMKRDVPIWKRPVKAGERAGRADQVEGASASSSGR
jgi:molybdopterin synthase catalytic subunit